MPLELHRADPKFRRVAPLLLAAVALLGAAAILLLQRWLGAARPPSDGLVMMLGGLMVVLPAISLGLAYSLWQESNLIRREDRYPPTDMRTLRDVAVHHGAVARRYASWMRAGAVAAGLCGIGVLVWGYRLLTLVA
jgi:hypothetical protein